jgi:hypothetical protein
MYRWDDGVITATNANYREVSPQLIPYGTRTVFYCDQLLNFRATACDPTLQNMAETPDNRWHRLMFENGAGFSRVDIGGQDMYLPATGPPWLGQLGLTRYCEAESDLLPLQSLAGDLAIILALIALSCRQSDLDQILVRERVWHRYRWRGHNHRHGSKQHKPEVQLGTNEKLGREKRGVLVEIFLDVNNPYGSTHQILRDLEMYETALLY